MYEWMDGGWIDRWIDGTYRQTDRQTGRQTGPNLNNNTLNLNMLRFFQLTRNTHQKAKYTLSTLVQTEYSKRQCGQEIIAGTNQQRWLRDPLKWATAVKADADSSGNNMYQVSMVKVENCQMI